MPCIAIQIVVKLYLEHDDDPWIAPWMNSIHTTLEGREFVVHFQHLYKQTLCICFIL
jgi:hypothetical protein